MARPHGARAHWCSRVDVRSRERARRSAGVRYESDEAGVLPGAAAADHVDHVSCIQRLVFPLAALLRIRGCHAVLDRIVPACSAQLRTLGHRLLDRRIRPLRLRGPGHPTDRHRHDRRATARTRLAHRRSRGEGRRGRRLTARGRSTAGRAQGSRKFNSRHDDES